MTNRGWRRDGWPWLAVFVVSALALTGGIWQLERSQLVVAASQPAPGATSSLLAAPPSPSAHSTTRAAANEGKGRASNGSTGRTSPNRKKDNKEPGPPRMLRIPRLKLAMPIIATTVDETGGMALPDRPTQIGWYAYGPQPGAKEGSAVLGGHIDSKQYGVGPLADLHRLLPGDEITVESEGHRLAFRVNSIRQIPKRAVPLAEVFDRSGRPRLSIVTCGGPYLPARGGYQDNLIVTATGQ